MEFDQFSVAIGFSIVFGIIFPLLFNAIPHMNENYGLPQDSIILSSKLTVDDCSAIWANIMKSKKENRTEDFSELCQRYLNKCTKNLNVDKMNALINLFENYLRIHAPAEESALFEETVRNTINNRVIKHIDENLHTIDSIDNINNSDLNDTIGIEKQKGDVLFEGYQKQIILDELSSGGINLRSFSSQNPPQISSSSSIKSSLSSSSKSPESGLKSKKSVKLNDSAVIIFPNNGVSV